MDGATLNINFRDESSQTPGGPGVVSQAGAAVTIDPQTAALLNAMAAAGGVGNFVAQAQPQQPPPASTTYQVPQATAAAIPPVNVGTASTDPLLHTVSQIVQADPKTTAEELAKALGIKQGQAQNLLDQALGTAQAQIAPPAQPVPSQAAAAPPSPSAAKPTEDDVELLLRRERRRQAEYQDEQRVQAEEQARIEQSRRPPPAPVTPPPQIPGLPGATAIEAEVVDTATGVAGTVNAISHFVHAFGPMGSAAAGLANTAVQLPGVASSLGAAVPALMAAAPFVGVGAAALAVPYAGLRTLEAVAEAARAQTQGLSPEVATAEAQANVRQLMANLRTSHILGDEIAEYVTGRSRLSTGVQGIRDIVFEPVLKDFAEVTKLLGNTAKGIADWLNDSPRAKWWVQTGAQVAQYGNAFGLLLKTMGNANKLVYPNDMNDIKDRNPLRYWNDNLPMPKLPHPFVETNMQPVNFERPRVPPVAGLDL